MGLLLFFLFALAFVIAVFGDVLLEVHIRADAQRLARHADRVRVCLLVRFIIEPGAAFLRCHQHVAADAVDGLRPRAVHLHVQENRAEQRYGVVLFQPVLPVLHIADVPAVAAWPELLCQHLDSPHAVDIGHARKPAAINLLFRLIGHVAHRVIDAHVGIISHARQPP